MYVVSKQDKAHTRCLETEELLNQVIYYIFWGLCIVSQPKHVTAPGKKLKEIVWPYT